jgi:hypothetical protein
MVHIQLMVQVWFCVITKERSFSPPAAPWSTVEMLQLVAIEEGLKLSLHWTDLRLVIETDSAEAIALINDNTPNTSVHAFKINVIREFLRKRESRILKVSRELNVVAHELARSVELRVKQIFGSQVSPRKLRKL